MADISFELGVLTTLDHANERDLCDPLGDLVEECSLEDDHAPQDGDVCVNVTVHHNADSDESADALKDA